MAHGDSVVGGEEGLRPRVATPGGWRAHVYERSWSIGAAREHVWAWLMDPATFTRQVWPYRVEFLDGTGVHGGGGFEVGTLNTHHGPLLNAAGVITRVEAGEDGKGKRRDLHYTYGAYVIGMRFVRPTLLRFDVADGEGGGAVVTLRLESDVAPWFVWAWDLGLTSFWGFFGGSIARGARKKARLSGAR